MIQNELDQRKAYAAPELNLFGDVATLTATYEKLNDPDGSGPLNPPICDHIDFPFCGCQ